ncbi:MAG: hypothetical protein QOD74_1849 [Variibacter sp.]|jgi:hypothetical protein|nr:hypothetical protein [Variibacter sp.]
MKRWAALMATVTLAGAGALWLAQADAQDAGWKSLMDTKSLDNWNRVADANWRIEEGAIVADKKEGKDPAYLVTKDQYKDFEIRAEFWVTTETNSGIFIRCQDPKSIGAKSCYEVNIWDARPDPSYGTGAIVDVAKVDPMPKAGGKWNTYVITAKGPKLTVTLNGQKTVDVENGQHATGVIALQFGEGVVKFRKVDIKAL